MDDDNIEIEEKLNQLSSKNFLVSNNKIYFYCDITTENILQLTKALHELNEELLLASLKYGIDDPIIEVHLDSDGGKVFSGFAGYNAIRASKIPVHTYVDGHAHSAATFLLLAGQRRFMYETSSILIHQLQAEIGGKFNDLIDEASNMESLMKSMRHIYKTNSKIPAKKLEEYLKREIYVDSKTCLDYGIVHEIV